MIVETVSLQRIDDLGWPTAPELVQSFRATLKNNLPVSTLLLQRVRRPKDARPYEIIDGFHQFAAAKAEGKESLTAQVVELPDREAQYFRIQACLGSAGAQLRERAILALRQAFVSDMLERLGHHGVLYEPVINGDGRVARRKRAAPLPDDPLSALEAMVNHVEAMQSRPISFKWQPVVLPGSALAPAARSNGKAMLLDWLEEQRKRWGWEPTWVLNTLGLQDLAMAMDLMERPQAADAMYEQLVKGVVNFEVWSLPDVPLREWVRNQLQASPEVSVGSFYALQDFLGCVDAIPSSGYQTYSKEVLDMLLQRYPTLSAVSDFVKGLRGIDETDLMFLLELEPEEVLPSRRRRNQSSVVREEPAGKQKEPSLESLSQPLPALLTPSGKDSSARIPAPALMTPYEMYQEAMQVVHIVSEIFEMHNRHYRRVWLQWKHAQAALAELQTANTPDKEVRPGGENVVG